ncbi:MAG: pyruvate kinase [Bacteroidota bacterium]|nr:Pyruvate kinase [Flavobacteriales bacterium]MCL4815405.1 pyruvate kinase [Flavobacteriales bacterium]WKZ75024.1 MAG: pyruvate kinase [Vicingaceae bacterium]GIK69966.1 MAG: pyruvate kinase [Bacteroidota bacterium]
MKPQKKTKIVATIGPASTSKEILREMIKAGMNVCRVNFSHGAYADHKKVLETIAEINAEEKTNIAVLLDLQGPKIRIGEVENNGVELCDEEILTITTDPCMGTSKRIYITYPEFPKDVCKGEKILLDDGKLVLEVISTNQQNEVLAKVINGGTLSSKKGVNLPNTKVSLPSLTKKDREDLAFALENNVEWIGLSFVRSATDIKELKKIIIEKGKDCRVVAKIEKPEALNEIDSIIHETDAVMVARGDLGVEIPMQQVPMIQKMLVKKCLYTGKPVIIATQMMESMIHNLTPSRAEVNDVANAVLDGADAVMLSAETSVGKHPVQVVQAMSKIICEAEKEESIYHKEYPPEFNEDRFISDSVCFNACRLSLRVKAEAIVTMTHSGYTALKVASARPKAQICVFTGNTRMMNMLSLVWGVQTFYYDKFESTDQTIADIICILKKEKNIKTKDLIINIASIPISEKGKSNMLKLSCVE